MKSFQERIHKWMLTCFGIDIACDRKERNHRFFEEASELVQANGMSREDAHMLVDYTYNRPVGEPFQEVGGVMVTLAALCTASNIDLEAAAECERARIWTKVEQIREKQKTKPKGSPLPQAIEADSSSTAPSDIPEAIELLSAVFDAWENGDDCYEDGDIDGSYMGKAFRLDDDVFKHCCDLLNRLNPPRNAAPVPTGESLSNWHFRSRVADLLHLLPMDLKFADGDCASAEFALTDIRAALATPRQTEDGRAEVLELFQNENHPLGDLDGDRPFCRFVWYEDGGDAGVGESARGYWALANDQAGTELADIIEQPAALATSKVDFEAHFGDSLSYTLASQYRGVIEGEDYYYDPATSKAWAAWQESERRALASTLAPKETAAQGGVPNLVESLRSMVIDYYRDLDARKHGGLAMDHAFNKIERALGMSWHDHKMMLKKE